MKESVIKKETQVLADQATPSTFPSPRRRRPRYRGRGERKMKNLPKPTIIPRQVWKSTDAAPAHPSAD